MSLIAEDMLLLLLDDEKGTIVGTSHLQIVLGGAMLIELATTGTVIVEEKQGMWKSAKVRVQPAPCPTTSCCGGQPTRRREGAVGPGPGDPARQRGQGGAARPAGAARYPRAHGGQGPRPVPATRWPTVDSTHEDAVRRQLTAALVQGVQPDQHTACLIALLAAIDRAHKVVDRDGLPAGQVRKRAKEIAQGEWAAKAVRDAIAASTAAVTAG